MTSEWFSNYLTFLTVGLSFADTNHLKYDYVLQNALVVLFDKVKSMRDPT